LSSSASEHCGLEECGVDANGLVCVLHSPADTDPFHTLSLVPKIRMPVLIMHGTDDWTAPFWMGERLEERLGREATFVPTAHGGHNNLGEDQLVPPALQWLKATARAIERLQHLPHELPAAR
jgi:pimeloyl-ACP methyl ester carboxylesterase